jgi:hypothetical protein
LINNRTIGKQIAIVEKEPDRVIAQNPNLKKSGSASKVEITVIEGTIKPFPG